MLRYILGWLSGACSLVLGMACFINPDNTFVNLTILVMINFAGGLWAYKHHKDKQQAYYNRFKEKNH